MCPAVVDIQNALNQYPNCPKNAEFTQKIDKWVVKLKAKNVSDTLDEDEIRELKFDLESSFQSFK